MMKRIVYVVFAVIMLAKVAPALAQDNASATDKTEAYRKAVMERSAKIVKALNLADSVRALKVTNIIARQYQDLNDIYTMRDDKRKAIKAEAGDDKEAAAAELKALDNEVTAKVDKLHPKYLKSLSKAGLTPEQVNQVKDGMTYNVLNVTYKAYSEMLLNLTETQKSQILAWLTEAREHAMDAESSEKKHAWFGKYKGRINNYLSTAGYDMKKEEAGWMERMKAAKNTSN